MCAFGALVSTMHDEERTCGSLHGECLLHCSSINKTATYLAFVRVVSLLIPALLQKLVRRW